MTQSSSANHAKSYYADGLSKADYYIDGAELQGQFGGRLAERLGLGEAVTKEAFYALCENKRPDTGKALTMRTKEERTCGYDLTFICPKSVSILNGLAKDNHIRDAFEQAVAETMKDVEKDSMARVRLKGAHEDRYTGELVFASFTHQTARAVAENLPDPYLHRHVYIFNSTFDEAENKFKAVQFREIMRNVGFYQACFHKRLADKLMALGYGIRKENQSFEVIGVPDRVLNLFSKRANEINRIAKEQGITEAKKLNELTVRTRAKKQKGLTMAELKTGWLQQIAELGTDQAEGDMPVRYAPIKEKQELRPEQHVQHALSHCFERASVMDEKRILATAYAHSIGNDTVSIDAITDVFKNNDNIIHVQDRNRTMCTTRQVLQEEKRMVELAHAGRGQLAPLYAYPPDIKLKDQQGAAIQHVLTTKDRVSIIRGAAGAGKTKLMQEAADWIEKAGKKIITAAPTAEASRGVLRKEGFKDAETVAKLLSDKDLQSQLNDQVLWVDEAGLLGTQDMTRLLELATEKNARLILGGDTRQHAAVVRGDALRILNTVGGIQTAEVSKIYRQRPQDYREAVQDLSNGAVKDGFVKLDQMGSIKEIDPFSPHAALVNDYMKTIKRGKSALVIAPTHKQGEDVTAEIRAKLRQSGRIGKKEIMAAKLANTNFTEAEKGDWRSFKPDQVIQFNQNCPGFRRGSMWTVKTSEDGIVRIQDKAGRDAALPLSSRSHYDVFNKTEIPLAKGDKVHITKNGFDQQQKRLNNRDSFDVASVAANGKITLRNPSSKAIYTLDKEFGHIAHAYCITSYASQGKTVDEVFISQPSSTFSASDAKQFYVSVSRGRDAARVYTDDKEALLEHVSDLGDRTSALELVSNKKNSHQEHVIQQQRNKPLEPEKSKDQEKARSIDKRKIDVEHEPRF